MSSKRLSQDTLNEIKIQLNLKRQTVFTTEEFRESVMEIIHTLEISESTAQTAVTRLKKMNLLRQVAIVFKGKKGRETLEKEYIRYAYNSPNKYQIVASIVKDSYYSYQTALYLNNIIKNSPKTIYLSSEQTLKSKNNDELLQENIDEAFQKPVRAPAMTGKYQSKEIITHSGKFTNRTGVLYHQALDIYYTSLERTLLDLVVRPNYAGGVKQVVTTFKKVRTKVDVQQMIGMLDELDYIYPYQQALGFYLEYAGYENSELVILDKMKKNYDFYLVNEISYPEYSERWKLYFPSFLA